MTVSPLTVYFYLIWVGFPIKTWNTMVCIAEKESSYRLNAVNVNNDRSVDLGLFQINNKWWGKVCDEFNLFDGIDNTKCAKIVYEKQGYQAWVTYNKGLCDV